MKKQYTGITLALSLALGLLLTTTAEARWLTLKVDRKYSAGSFIGLKKMAKRQYEKNILRGKSLIAIEVKGNSTQSTKSELSLVVNDDEQSSDRLKTSLERIILKNNESSSGSWELGIDRGPAYIEEIVLIVGKKNKQGECGRACQRSCDTYTSSDSLESFCNYIGSDPTTTRNCYIHTNTHRLQRACLSGQPLRDSITGCDLFTSNDELQEICLEEGVTRDYARKCYFHSDDERGCLEDFNKSEDEICGPACKRACDTYTSSDDLERFCRKIVSDPTTTRNCYIHTSGDSLQRSCLLGQPPRDSITGCDIFTSNDELQGICLEKAVPRDYARNCYFRSDNERKCLENFTKP